MLNRTEVAREIVAIAGLPNGGLLLDAYHMQCAGEGRARLRRRTRGRDTRFPVSDARRDRLRKSEPRSDRLPPGTGAADWNGVFGLLMDKSYAGYIVYEAPNPAQ